MDRQTADAWDRWLDSRLRGVTDAMGKVIAAERQAWRQELQRLRDEIGKQSGSAAPRWIGFDK